VTLALGSKVRKHITVVVLGSKRFTDFSTMKIYHEKDEIKMKVTRGIE
jgi:hypothetical protein